jgi:hypothetical protein
MVINYPHAVASREELTVVEDHQPSEEPLSGRVLGRVRQLFCALHGHDSLLQFEQERMFLRCVSCGHESPGWELNEAPPIVLNVQDEHPPALVRPQLIRARRIA